MAASNGDPIATLIAGAGEAMSGDPVMLRSLAATLGSFSVRLLAALLLLALTLWVAKKLARVAQRAIERLPHHSQAADQTLALFVSTLV